MVRNTCTMLVTARVSDKVQPVRPRSPVRCAVSSLTLTQAQISVVADAPRLRAELAMLVHVICFRPDCTPWSEEAVQELGADLNLVHLLVAGALQAAEDVHASAASQLVCEECPCAVYLTSAVWMAPCQVHCTSNKCCTEGHAGSCPPTQSLGLHRCWILFVEMQDFRGKRGCRELNRLVAALGLLGCPLLLDSILSTVCSQPSIEFVRRECVLHVCSTQCVFSGGMFAGIKHCACYCN
jgi:hypothetical protein